MSPWLLSATGVSNIAQGIDITFRTIGLGAAKKYPLNPGTEHLW